MGVQRTLVVGGFVLAFLLSAIAAPVQAATTIGLYTDANGSSCSFAGNQTGVIDTYVIVKPDALGISGVRFAVPVPECFSGTWLADFKPDDSLQIGDSPLGTSVAFTSCGTVPRVALRIQYFRTSSTACCAFPIEPDPFTGIIEGTTCALQQASMIPIVAHVNADATCPCAEVNPPHPPESPVPTNNAINISANTSLDWSPSPLDADVQDYDVYIGTTQSPLLVATVTQSFYQPPQPLAEGTVHYWQIVVRDTEGYTSPGPLWSFRTSGNFPPNPPGSPSPADGAANVALVVTLDWLTGDPDNDPMTYDVYFGTTSNPPLVASNHVRGYELPILAYATQYFWRIVARDSKGGETSGPVWSFTTRVTNGAPLVPFSPSPVANALVVPVNSGLSWQCSDPDGDPVNFDVYFGFSNPPALVATGITAKSYQGPLMAFQTTYYWKVIARDTQGFTTAGPLWTFSTRPNAPPSIPANPSPANGATKIWVNPTLMWTSTDEYPGMTFDVYFGTTNPPPLVAFGFSGTSYSLPQLSPTTQYFWKIIARDVQGLQNTGPVWAFYTAAVPVPFQPSPGNAGLGGNPLMLRWSCSTPNNQTPQCDVYFGTTDPPPLVATGITPYMGQTGFQFAPSVSVATGTTYYWRIFASDNLVGGMGPLWTFTGATQGDVNGDGLVTVDDAACALQVAVNKITCAGTARAEMAAVDCTVGVSARDALCIHRRAIGQSCPYCGESETIGAVSSPVVTRSSYSLVDNTLTTTLAVAGLPSLEAFKFHLRMPFNVQLTAVTRVGASQNFEGLEKNWYLAGADVAGYGLTPVNTTISTDFVEMQFVVSGTLSGFIVAENFQDDLAGAASVTIVAGSGKGGGGELPVTFTRFGATLDDDGVRIAWQLRANDALESYTLFRHEDGKTPLALAGGAITGTTGSYLDRSAEAGKTYRYEMLVHTAAGDDVRSQLVTITVARIGLTLGPNHPNPFNPQTTIPYYVPTGAGRVHVRLAIYDTQGRAVRVLVNEDQASGAHDVLWHGEDETGSTVSSGIYFCVLQVGSERRTQKLVMLK